MNSIKKIIIKVSVLYGIFFFCASQFLLASDEMTKTDDPYKSLAAALCIAIAAFGGALGQGRTATAALEAIGRNPAAQGKIFVPMIIALALIESLVLYAFVIAFVKI